MDFILQSEKEAASSVVLVNGCLFIEDAQNLVGWSRNNGDNCDGYCEASRSYCWTQVYSPGHYSFAILCTKFSPTFFRRAIFEVSKACSMWNYKAEYLFPCQFAGLVSGSLLALWFGFFPFSTCKELCHMCVLCCYSSGWDMTGSELCKVPSNWKQIPLSPLFPKVPDSHFQKWFRTTLKLFL